jgi:hypothetical protein
MLTHAQEESLNAIDYILNDIGSFVDFYHGPDVIDSWEGDDLQGDVQETIKEGNALALEEVQMLDDQAMLG